MIGSVTRTWKQPRRRLVAAAALAVAATAAIVVADQNASGGSGPVYLVLTHPTIRAGGSDTVVVVNNSINRLNTTGAAISPRISSHFALHSSVLTWDDPHNSVSPYATRHILEPSWSTYPPGKYWVWTAYEESNDTTLYLHAKLTIVAR